MTNRDEVLADYPHVKRMIARGRRSDAGTQELLRLLMEVSRLRRVNVDLQRQRADLRKRVSYYEMLHPEVSDETRQESPA